MLPIVDGEPRGLQSRLFHEGKMTFGENQVSEKIEFPQFPGKSLFWESSDKLILSSPMLTSFYGEKEFQKL